MFTISIIKFETLPAKKKKNKKPTDNTKQLFEPVPTLFQLEDVPPTCLGYDKKLALRPTST